MADNVIFGGDDEDEEKEEEQDQKVLTGDKESEDTG